MIARGAIGAPWIFKQARELLNNGKISTTVDYNFMIETAIKHLEYEVDEADEERRAIIPFRKFWTGYLKYCAFIMALS